MNGLTVLSQIVKIKHERTWNDTSNDNKPNYMIGKFLADNTIILL